MIADYTKTSISHMNETITDNRSALILLVEDDPSMLDGMHDLFLMPSLLQSVGINFNIDVRTASNGKEALVEMKNQTPDLIVSDIMMPVMDGYQLLNAVQANPDWFHIPFIFLTAKGNKKEILEGQLRGANLYITKPFVSTELLELIKSQLDRSFQRQNTHQLNVAELKRGILQILNHEFRTPLTYVTAYYEMLADSLQRFPNHKNFREYLRGIQAGVIRLTKLIEDFILVIELRTGEFKTKFQQRAKLITNVNELVQLALQDRESAIQSQEIRVHFNAAPDLPAVWGDEESLGNVFRRFISNAVKFTPKEPTSEKNIYISTKATADNIVVTFKDEGLGFPHNVKSQIFDLFFQYNRGILEQQGAGIGLTIAKGLTDLHRGRIEVASEEGVGSTFEVILPIAAADFEQIESPGDNLAKSELATILVVEDEIDLLIGLRELLLIFGGKYQFEVVTATNGREGLAVLKETPANLIISDIMMPIMDGYEFLQEVRQNPKWVDIPFIFLTAKGEHQDIHRGLRSGAEVYITKPYNSDELLQLITAQLDQHFQLQGVRLQGFDSLKRSILNLITPDFRLPLSAVQEYSDALAAGLVDVQNDLELKDTLNGIRDGSTRLMQLVEDFISLAELRTGEAESAYALREQPIHNPGLRFCEIAHILASTAEAASVQLHCEFAQDLPPVYGDSLMLSEGVKRLIEIGIKLSQSDRQQHIHLSSRQESGELHFVIELPAVIHIDELQELLLILAEDEVNLIEMTDYAPAMIIAKGYIGLNNGRIRIGQEADTNYSITLSLPIYTPAQAT